jgi:hypothetical protein
MVTIILPDLLSNGVHNSVCHDITNQNSNPLSFLILLSGRDFSSHVIATIASSPLTSNWKANTLRKAYPRRYSSRDLASHTVLLLLPYQVYVLITRYRKFCAILDHSEYTYFVPLWFIQNNFILNPAQVSVMSFCERYSAGIPMLVHTPSPKTQPFFFFQYDDFVGPFFAVVGATAFGVPHHV